MHMVLNNGVEIPQTDLKVDTYSNVRVSAWIASTPVGVQITHLPTDIITRSHESRSQYQNRNLAMAQMKDALEKDNYENTALNQTMPVDKFMIGQRVIYGKVICVVCAPEHVNSHTDPTWIDNPEKGHKHWVDIGNLKALPNGQL